MRRGHPWIYDESVRDQNRAGEAGEVAVAYDRNDQFLAVGLYDPASPIRVRVLQAGAAAKIDGDWFRARLNDALALRASILDGETDAARLVNGESDKFPALVLDRYAGTLVLKLYSAIWFPWLEEVAAMIRETLNPRRLVLRLSRNLADAAARRNLRDGQILFGDPASEPVEFRESGLRFEADVIHGQKTGFFLDQRENRRRVERLAAGKDVLNGFSFSGGFSVYAARGGARSVTDVDISAHALESSRRNFALNSADLRRTRHETIQADVFEWLRQPRQERYDLIVLDPPSLAKREGDRAGALQAYAALALAGARLARPGATLVCCSCSAHVRSSEFFETVPAALRQFGRRFQVVHQAGQPLDHPATFAEAEYLKAIYLALD